MEADEILVRLFFVAALGYMYFRLRVRRIKETEARKTEIEKIKAASLQHQLEIEQVINYFATSISCQSTTDDLLWDVARNCISKLGFEDCVIYLKDDEHNLLVQKAAWGPKTTADNKIINPIVIPIGKGIVGSVTQSGKAERIADTSADSRYIVDDARRLSEIAVPIISNGKVIGVIDSEHREKDFFTEHHLHILTTIASLCADKIDKIKAQQLTREKEIEVIKLNRDLATSQLTALRAQMNPHFTFNTLNSIQQYIMMGNVTEANRYLSKFAKLQREILNHCEKNFISLEKEKEMLELYLQLEQLRFRDTFSYAIVIDEEIDADEVKLPPMLVQPFVENAIWHGLMPKQGEKTLTVEFRLHTEDMLCCTVRDNGIGREASGRLKRACGNGDKHISKGLSLVYQRLRILQKQYGHPFDVQITDNADERGNVAGTAVELLLFTDIKFTV